MHTGPYSPDATAHVPTSLDPWTKFFPVANSQSDSESSHYRLMSPECSSSSSEGTDGDNMHIPDLPPQFRRYPPQPDQPTLSPSFTLLGQNGTTSARKGKKSSPTKRSKSTKGKRSAQASKAAGHVADNGATASGYPEDWAPLNAQDLQGSWGVADQPYVQDMYERSMDRVAFDWDGVKDRMLDDTPEGLLDIYPTTHWSSLITR